eukprot:TRINITY_DN12779_c0_g1_i1.p1 TRINITY_DN12779_c0_g1~~TRINITY_DN12779_c0_g1_i1.p1  ORF type:complete len:261 (-),score=48.33 TRINITY_DN12779_c0_g1_i1:43-744(-)
MTRRPVRRKDAALDVEDETDEFIEAIKSGNAETVFDMLKAVSPEDANVWLREPLDDHGRTSLHHALLAPQEAHLRLVRMLCKNRADVNAAGPDGVQPIHLSAQCSTKYVLRALCCAGAKNTNRTADGRSTVDFAALHPSPVEMFEVVGWPGEGPREDPCKPRRRPEQPIVDSAGVWKSQPTLCATTQAANKAEKVEAADPTGSEGTSLTWPLFLAAIWFAFLGVVAALVIRSV